MNYTLIQEKVNISIFSKNRTIFQFCLVMQQKAAVRTTSASRRCITLFLWKTGSHDLERVIPHISRHFGIFSSLLIQYLFNKNINDHRVKLRTGIFS